MKITGYKHLLTLIILFGVTLGAYFLFAYSPYYDSFVLWAQRNPLIFYPILLVSKIFGIVWPPFPGGVLTLAAVPIVGWWQAYLVDISGSMLGSTIAYGIARTWGRRFVASILDQQTIRRIDRIRVRPGKEFEAVFLFRVFGGTVVEIVVYAAGLLRVPFKQFLLASIISHMITGVPLFYFAQAVLQRENIIVNIILLTIAVVLFITLRKRYFESYSSSVKA